MWVRKQIDISFFELFWGLGRCLLPASEIRLTERIKSLVPSHQLLVSLSVRSGFELLWTSLDLKEGSEVIMSGFTIPDMARIIEKHGLKVVPIDVDPRSFAPDIREIRRQITPKTKAIVVAHLWGGLVDLSEMVQVAKDHDLLLIEDCAQAYVGNDYLGDPRSDVAMFSFGTIKTNTALGGAIIRVDCQETHRKMERTQRAWPVQSRTSYFNRLIKYLLVKTISTRPIARMISQLFQIFGSNHDVFASRLAKGFSGREFFKRIRKRPSKPLLSMLYRKLSGFSRETIVRRQQLGQRLTNQLTKSLVGQPRPVIVGGESIRQTFWLYGVLVDDPQTLACELWKAGFDATQQSSMRCIDPQKRDALEFSDCRALEQRLLLLPVDFRMRASEIDRMANVIHESSSTVGQLDNEGSGWLRVWQSKQHADV